MTDASARPRRGPLRRWLSALLDSAALARAFTLTTLGAVLSQAAITGMAGRTVYATVIVGLCLLGAAVLWRRRREVELLRLLPLTLVALLAWLLITMIWSTSPMRTLGAWLTVAALAFLAIVIVHVRDTLQTVRALGDVLRVLLSVSLALEILSGILLDLPIPFLGIEGNIAELGPVQGIFGTRNMLGLVCVVAIITFVVEARTRAIRPGLGWYSVSLAALLALLSASPTVFVLAIAVAAATGALILVRRARPASRPALQLTIGGVVTAGLAVAFALRHPIIALLDAGSDFSTRADLWNMLLIYVGFRPVVGWGWQGLWPDGVAPFAFINALTRDSHASALNAYFDLLLQTGWVGLLLFAAMCVLAAARSWLVATARRSVLYAWTPLVLVTLLVDSMLESFTLTGLGWLLLVICVLRAGMARSWREGFSAAGPRDPARGP